MKSYKSKKKIPREVQDERRSPTKRNSKVQAEVEATYKRKGREQEKKRKRKKRGRRKRKD